LSVVFPEVIRSALSWGHSCTKSQTRPNEGRNPVALSGDLGAGGVHGRLGRHAE
jgi:hypothetical protein